MFHAWKCAQLKLIRQHFNRASDLSDNDKIPLQFLKCHELKSSGNNKEGFLILEALSKTTKSEIIFYRYAAEFIDRKSLNDAFPLMEKAIDVLPEHRRIVIQFNYGMAACNQSNFAYAAEALKKLAQNQSDSARFFYQWLRGAIEHQSGDFDGSLKSYDEALALCKNLPSRANDLCFIAYAVLEQSFWVGHLEKAKSAFETLNTISQMGLNSLGQDRFTLAEAMLEFLKGDLSAAFRRLDFLFECEELNRDHLVGAFVYLWLLLALGKFSSVLEIIPKLEALRDRLCQSDEFYDFKLFELYAGYLRKLLSEGETFKGILAFARARAHALPPFHREWAEGIMALFDKIPFKKIEAAEKLRHFPLLERTVIWLLAQDKSLRTPLYWRHIQHQTKDTLAKALANYRLSQLTGDSELFLISAKAIYECGGFSWIERFDEESCSFTNELASRAVGASFIVDMQAQRVIAADTGESLDSQPQLTELFLSLYSHRQGCEKEVIALAQGAEHYDPSRHDAVIYSLLSRMRDWLRRHDRQANIIHSPRGWRLNFFERIVKFDREESARVSLLEPIDQGSAPSSNREKSSENVHDNHLLISQLAQRNPRWEWIMSRLQKTRTISRKEIMDQFKVKRSTATNDLNQLFEDGLLLRCGQGRGTFYRLKGATGK